MSRCGRDAVGVSGVSAVQPVKHEGGCADLPGGPGRRQPRCHGDRRPQLWTQEAQGGLPRGEQQVQVWRVRRTDGHTHSSQR